MTPTEFRSALRTLGVSQRWLADKLGVDFRTVNRWANGKLPVPQYAQFPLELLIRIAQLTAGLPNIPIGERWGTPLSHGH